MISTKNLKKPETLWLVVILCLAAALRFYHYGSFSYSNDELSALNRLHYNTFAELVQKGFYIDGHPGGIQVFLWQWVRLFGETEWVVRLPFVIVGILSVWMSYMVARFMFGTAAGLFTAAAITFLQFPLLYSQIARPYGPGMLFCLMLVYFWLLIFFKTSGEVNTSKPKIYHLAGFAISAALCMYTHYFSFLFALIVGLSGFVVARRYNILHYLVTALVAALLFVPHIPITLNHLTYKGVGLWLGVPAKGWIFEHLYYIFDQSLFIILVFLITLLSLLYNYQENKNNRRFRLFLASWFLLPALIGYIYSVKINPVLQHSVLIFSFPYFILLIFSYAGNDFDKKKRLVLTFFLAAGIVATTAVNSYYKQQHFGEFKDIARLTAKWQQQYGDTAITRVICVNAPFYIDYYLKRNQTEVKFDLYDINGSEGLKSLSEIVKNSKKPYFIYALTKPAPAEGEDIIRSVYPFILEMKTYKGFSSIVLFGKQKGQTYEKANHLTELKTFVAVIPTDSLVHKGANQPGKAYKMDSLMEYSPGIEVNLDEFRENENLVIKAETDLFVSDNSGGSVLVISIESKDGESITWKGAVSAYTEIPGRWCHVINSLKIGTSIPKDAKLKVYFWNKDKKELYIRNLHCSFWK